jgi:hypothetical protein
MFSVFLYRKQAHVPLKKTSSQLSFSKSLFYVFQSTGLLVFDILLYPLLLIRSEVARKTSVLDPDWIRIQMVRRNLMWSLNVLCRILYDGFLEKQLSGSVLRIRDVYTGFRIRIFPSRIQGQKDPGSASENLIIFSTKNCFCALGNMILDPDFFSMSDPKKAPDPGSRYATLVWIRVQIHQQPGSGLNYVVRKIKSHKQ